MDLIGSSSFIIPDRSPMSGEGADGDIVIWLRGEHDISTDDALSLTLARAVALDDSGLVLDLSDVEFMSASTLGVIVRAREFLRGRSLSLTVRSPSARARRAMGACHLDDLLGPGPEKPGDEKKNALGTWVEVPSAPRGDQQAAPSPRGAEHVPVRAGRTVDLGARALRAEGRTQIG